MLGGAKISPWFIVRAQHETYVDDRTGRPRWQDYVVFYGLPVLALGVCLWRQVELSLAASGALLAASGLLSALLFGVMLQVSDRAMSWADDAPQPSAETSNHAAFLRELAANAGYASLVSIAAAIAYVVSAMSAPEPTETDKAASGGTVLEAATAVGLALGVHLVLVLLMVMKRVFALTEERLTTARTGGDKTVLQHRRRSASGG